MFGDKMQCRQNPDWLECLRCAKDQSVSSELSNICPNRWLLASNYKQWTGWPMVKQMGCQVSTCIYFLNIYFKVHFSLIYVIYKVEMLIWL